ncbi:uncharacterized protein LOC132175656 isoform X2 [Corylus avellana]|uniref:uncharacterized protein LOC132175656 isoform X2 n=1 Tax=Corylus avellana TaxID=13451 RepID=UPI00286AA084|nr:uncharacterized protein LOC132175656 isoform X2 [Corylus avellana]
MTSKSFRHKTAILSEYQSMCSSSKIPLHGCGVLATQSTTQRKRKQFSDNPASVNLETSGNLSTLPKLTISPLRKFQLIDSDSDDSSSHDNVSREAHKAGPSSTERQSNPDHSATVSEQKRKASLDVNKNEDLWKDFCPMKNFRIQTPALDEVCEEYFLSLKKSVTLKSRSDVCVNANEVYQENTTSSRKDGQVWVTDDPVPPAHHYFFHDDPRVQKLVRDRLPNFSPLGVTKSRGNQQPNASVIDYMRQFNHEEASKQRTCKSNVEKSSTRGRNKSKISNAEEVLLPSGGWMDPKIVSSFSKGEPSRQKAARKINVANRSTKGRNRSKKSNAEEVLHAPESWVNPKSSASTPKDAGQRRVHANGESAGHWYTTPEGRKAYVTKDGKELTGRTAYRHYRKESGAGFKKSKKKTSAKGKKRKG